MDTYSQKEPWRESLFDICASPLICCKGLFCTECLFGQNAADIKQTSCFGYCCVYCLLFPFFACGLIHMPIRAKIREKYGLQEDPSDVVAACLLSPLAVCQEAREIQSRERTAGGKVQTTQPLKKIVSTADTEGASTNNSTHAS